MKESSMCKIASPPYPAEKHHVMLFPFMSKGHTIPILHLARLLIQRDLAVTVFTTGTNRPFISQFLADVDGHVFVIDLPFPDNISDDIPVGTESTDKLPSMSLFYKFTLATKHMQDHFERALATLPKPIFLVSDGFLWWTLDSAEKFEIPRLFFFGMNCYSTAVYKEVMGSGVLQGARSDDELVSLKRFPWISITRNDISKEFLNLDPQSLVFEFNKNVFSDPQRSYGQIINTFYELESVFVDYVSNESKPHAWCVGPLCLAEPPPKRTTEPTWIRWLDQMSQHGRPILYVAFGTQAEISHKQFVEIAKGLEESRVNFLWVVREGEWEMPEGFEERVRDRGMVVRDWVDQREILMHESTQGFLSHCGWNSVLESICAGVPILAWPMMAEQHLNARMVHEEIRVGLRVETHDGSVIGLVTCQGLKKMVKELMVGEKGRQVRENVKEVAEMAKNAVKKGGSSCRTLDLLIEETRDKKIRDENMS